MPLIGTKETIPVGFSSTPTLEANDSVDSETADEREQMIEIDELMMPSSPPINNKSLKMLFQDRMGMVLL
jgi:hypothetical protein